MSEEKIVFTPQEAELVEKLKNRTYLDPRYDAAFKALLNDEAALVSFLNGVLHLAEKERIVKVEIRNPELNILFPETKSFRFDIRATTESGYGINVEMQKVPPTNFTERILLQHSAFVIQSKYEYDKKYKELFPLEPTEEQRAEREARRYDFPPTYAIWVCDFKIARQKGYHDVWSISNGEGLTVTEKIKYIMLDLSQFTKSEGSLENDEDRWLYLIKNAGQAESLPNFDDEVFADALRRIFVGNANKQLLKDQVNNMMTDDEHLDFIAYHTVEAKRKGHAEGHAEGRAEGRAEGLAEGRAEGLAEGRAEGLAEGLAEGCSSTLDAVREAGASDELMTRIKEILAGKEKLV